MYLNTTAQNPQVRELDRLPGESNLDWGQRAASEMGTADSAQWAHLALVGGADLLSFRLRIAQAHLRADMLPSYWSDAALIVLGDNRLAGSQAIHVPLLQPDSPEFAAWSNGVVERPLAHFEDPKHWPNLALIALPVAQSDVVKAITDFSQSRSSVDALAHVVHWLAFAWGVERSGNPLHDNYGLPSACLLEAVFASLQFDLTPGVDSRRSCPESIWAAARRWHEYYARTGATDSAAGRTPVGRYVIGHSIPLFDEPAADVAQRRAR